MSGSGLSISITFGIQDAQQLERVGLRILKILAAALSMLFG
jgi:hypothetical protein